MNSFVFVLLIFLRIVLQEDPGESLSDCDKDDDDEKCDADEDDEVVDGFVVPDGYLSESEVNCIFPTQWNQIVDHMYFPSQYVMFLSYRELMVTIVTMGVI